MNKPKSIKWVLGINGLGFLLDQERKHWLLKTDKNKQTQDDVTGDIFQGQIDNRGSNIVIESEKLPYKTNILSEISFVDKRINDILSPAYSAFTYTSSLNGLLFARIKSPEYSYMGEDTLGFNVETKKNYTLEFNNATEVIIPFASSNSSDEVYATKWIKTTTVPKLGLVDDDNSTKINVSMNPSVTNVTYYYPLNSNMHMLGIHRKGDGSYITDPVNSASYIGYPLFWFTCDNSNVGPTTSISNNESTDGNQLIMIGNEGNSSKYTAKAYFGLYGNMNNTPDASSSTNWCIKVSPMNNGRFNNSNSDYTIPLDKSNVLFVNEVTGQTTTVSFESDHVNKLLMDDSVPWTYISETEYKIELSEYDINCLSVSNNALTPGLTIEFDQNIPFTTSTSTDIGIAGIDMSPALSSDQSKYPLDLNKWSGLPEWLNDTDQVPQHLAIYAAHNTPFYTESIPTSRQVAALILDPGKQVVEGENTELDNDERGRVYVISNDDAEYENNATTEHPKPARTVARICDIPTSVTQFMNVHGIAPISVVDKQYVRTEVPFKEEDINRLYNTLGTKIVVPTMYTNSLKKLYDPENPGFNNEQDNEYIFNSEALLNEIQLLLEANGVRELINLNPIVEPSHVKVNRIVDGGEGYKVNDYGIIIIGGAALEYIVTDVDENGSVKELSSLAGVDVGVGIHLSNFGIDDDDFGFTSTFGTARSIGVGAGLKLQFFIDNYHDIKTQYGVIKDELIAFVKDKDGLYLYAYRKNPNTTYGENGKWEKVHLISQFEMSYSDKSKGGTSSSDAFLNTTIPSFKPVTISMANDNTEQINLKTITTGSMINIIDKDAIPFSFTGVSDDNDIKRVDICGWQVSPLYIGTAYMSKDTNRVIEYFKTNKLGQFDTYIAWRWTSSNSMNRDFEYCFIRRTFNNYLNTDVTTLIPDNKLENNSFVHSNPNTTVVWDVPNFGPMMWIYSPNYTKHERYHIDQETQDMYIGFTNEDSDSCMNWHDFKTVNQNKEEVYIADPITKLMNFNILSNSIYDNGEVKVSNANIEELGVYAQPSYQKIYDKKDIIGDSESSIRKPAGNWRLVFPRVDMYSFKEETGILHPELKLRLLHTVKGNNVDKEIGESVTNIFDSNGNRVNSKCLIFDETEEATKMLIFNNTLGAWIKL